MTTKFIISLLFKYNDRKFHQAKVRPPLFLLLTVSIFCFMSCKQKPLPNQAMIDLLKTGEKYSNTHENPFAPEAMVKYCDSVINNSTDQNAVITALDKKANALLELGQEQKAIDIFQEVLNKIPRGYIDQRQPIMKDLAITYLRLGERMNCINMHNAESCIFPISKGGVHHDKTGSENAIEIYKALLSR